MQLHKFDNYQAKAQSGLNKPAHIHRWRTEPSSPDEWINHWRSEGGIWIPSTNSNRPVFLEIESITPTSVAMQDKAEYLIEAKNSRPFFVKFAQNQRAFSPLTRPTLIIPHHSLKQAWWLLSAN